MIGPLLLAGFAVLSLGLGWQYEIWSFGAPGPGLMPLVGALIMLLACLASFSGKTAEASEPIDRPAVANYIVGLVALPTGIMVLGMLPALALFTAVTLRGIERMRTVQVFVITAATAIGSWLLFEKLLHVPLPKPLFW
jgi:putative tricarboxylic transport membrane protein